MALIPEDPKQRNALVLGLLMLVGLYFFHTYWYSPRNLENDRMETRLNNLEAQNQRARVMATRGGDELETRLAVYERHIEQLERLIPASEEVPSLLNAITLEAHQSGVELLLMSPENRDQGPFYTRHTFSMGVVGEFHSVGRFLTAIASLPRVISPIDINLSLYTGPNPPQGESPVNAQFRIQTYVLPAGSAPADAVAAADGDA